MGPVRNHVIGDSAVGIDVELIYDGKAELAEGPMWYDNALWWVDILAGELNRLDRAVRYQPEPRAWRTSSALPPPCEDGRWLVARRRELGLLDWQTGNIEKIAAVEHDKPTNRFNDGKCDPAGCFWVGTMNLSAKASAGSLYCLTHDWNVRRLLDNVTISNGLGWSPDGTRFYYADTATQRVDVFDCDLESGDISDRRPLIEVPTEQGCPDGLTG